MESSSKRQRSNGAAYAGDRTDNNLTFLLEPEERIPEGELERHFSEGFGAVHRVEYIPPSGGSRQSRCYVGFFDSRDMLSALAAMGGGRTRSSLLGRTVSYPSEARGTKLVQQTSRAAATTSSPGAVHSGVYETPFKSQNTAYVPSSSSSSNSNNKAVSSDVPPATANNAWSLAGRREHYCESCDKSMPSQSSFDAHVRAHERCSEPGCVFSGSKRAVAAHFHSTHGQFQGSGYREIAVEGMQFRVLLGTTPEEVGRTQTNEGTFRM